MQKVLWTEGMFLTPHHLQQWDRYHTGILKRQWKALNPFGWGVRRLQIDAEALSGGNFVLSELQAVMPDGLVLDMPENDPLPSGRPIAPFFPSQQDVMPVYLAVPVVRQGIVESSPDGAVSGRPTRYRSRAIDVRDSQTGVDEKQIEVGSINPRLVFEGEPLEETAWLKIAEIGRTATGGYKLVENFVPACLAVASSAYITAVLKRVIEIVATKVAGLSAKRRQRGERMDFTTSEAANFYMLHTLNAWLPGLMHFHHNPQLHPEQLYAEMLHLAGQMYSFAPKGSPKDLPPYVHDDLRMTFLGLEKHLRSLLETEIASRCVPIALERTTDTISTARFEDDSLLEKAQLFLAVMTTAPEDKVAREVPIKAKISSRDRVELLIAQALRGIPLRYMAAPSNDLPVKPGQSFFEVDKSTDHWEAVRNSRTISFYVPPEFPNLRLEFMALKE